MKFDRTWYFDEIAADTREMQEELNISAIIAGLLNNRGLTDINKARKFLYGTREDLSDPLLLPGMQQAADRIRAAIAGQERMVIYGDYDVDGMCSIVILKECLEMLGGKVDYYVPDRFEEGYGINMPAVENLVKQKYELLISVDCGITSVEEVGFAVAAGMDIIITDHHTPGAMLPPAAAIVNPKLGGNEDNRHLCGAGVAYYLARALQQGTAVPITDSPWLELAALATIADIVPLRGDNHILVREGLKHLSATRRTGLKALIKICALEGKDITPGQVGFVIAPRLNAAGRLDSAQKGIELLLTSDGTIAENLAVYLNTINNERRQVEENIYEQALAQIMTNERQEDRVIIAAGENWHEGVIGIVASRLVEKFYRPVIIINWEGDRGKGSGRSIKDFDLHGALEHCQEHLCRFGGHQMAAGLTIERRQLDLFAAAVKAYAQKYMPREVLYRVCRTDGEIDMAEITFDLLQELKRLAPYGEGNPQPQFIVRNIPLRSLRLVGSQKEHISFDFSPLDLQGIAFRKPEYINLPFQECWHDVVGTLGENEYQGKVSRQINVKEMKMSFIPDDIKRFRGLEHMPYRQIKLILTEIKAGRPVIMLFPAARSLLKYKPGLENCFKNDWLHVLHGLMPNNKQTAAAGLLSRGRAGIYLITRAYFENRILKGQLPANLRYILPGWNSEPITGLKDPASIAESIKWGCSAEAVLKSIRPITDFDSRKKNLIYSNRQSTITDIMAGIPTAISEAALTDFRQRRVLRREFTRWPEGTYITDGNYYIGEGFDDIDNVVLADFPFSICETAYILEQSDGDREPGLIIAAGEKQREQNWSYLNRRHPVAEEVLPVLDHLQRAGRRQQKLEEMTRAIQEEQGEMIPRMKMLAILQILADTGLCQISKQGSIMEIHCHSNITPVLNINDSIAYQEGMREKQAWQELLAILELS